MMHGNCKCFHHWVTKLLVVLAWVSAFAFWWASWKGMMVWGMAADHWFQDVIVFSLLAWGTVFCGCCGKSKMMEGGMGMGGMCKHDAGCTCGDCGRCK